MRLLYIGALFALLILGGCGGSDSSSVLTSPNAATYQKALDDAVAQVQVPGAVMAIRTPDGQTWEGASGIAEYERNISMNTSMHLHVGSVTKTFTATAVMMLIDRNITLANGKPLTLDTTLNDVLPELGVVNGDTITLKMLMNMTSGLKDYSTLNPDWLVAFDANSGRIWLPKELVAYSNAIDAAPGVKYHYSNANYILLGMIIEKITSMSYADAITQMILVPLQLNDTSVPLSANMPVPYASGYRFDDNNTFINASFIWDPSWAWSAGNMVSTASDMRKWATILADGTLLSAKMREARLPVQGEPSGQYGLGIVDINYENNLGHNGAYNVLYTAWVFRYHGYDVAILSNGQASSRTDNQADAGKVFWNIVQALGW